MIFKPRGYMEVMNYEISNTRTKQLAEKFHTEKSIQKQTVVYDSVS